MDQIIIPYESDILIDNSTIKIVINNKDVLFITKDNSIVIDKDIIFGVNLLRIELINSISNGCTLKLKDFYLNGASSRQAFYLSYYTNQDNKKVCSTWITDDTNNLTIPFGNPISWWLGEVGDKFYHTLYGTNLYDTYEIFYSESIEIDERFPRVMQDFMKYSFGFHAYRKDCLKDFVANKKIFPWIKIKLDIDEKDLLAELERNKELIEANPYRPTQNTYNTKESPSLDLWHLAPAIPTTVKCDLNNWKELIVYSKEDFPVLHKLLDWVISNGIRIDHAFISQVKAMSYVAPHRDNYYKYDPYKVGTEGCTQITVPLGFTPGSWFKFDNVGMVPTDCPTILNTSEFMHGSINQSEKDRYVIGIYCEHFDNTILKYALL